MLSFLPRSTRTLPLASSGAQNVATLPSTAASAYMPASSEDACAGRHWARLSVGIRSGRRVMRISGLPPETSWVPCGDSTANGWPAVAETVVLSGPTETSKVRPCQCRPFRTTPRPSCGGSIGSRYTRSASVGSRRRAPLCSRSGPVERRRRRSLRLPCSPSGLGGGACSSGTPRHSRMPGSRPAAWARWPKGARRW